MELYSGWFPNAIIVSMRLVVRKKKYSSGCKRNQSSAHDTLLLFKISHKNILKAISYRFVFSFCAIIRLLRTRSTFQPPGLEDHKNKEANEWTNEKKAFYCIRLAWKNTKRAFMSILVEIFNIMVKFSAAIITDVEMNEKITSFCPLHKSAIILNIHIRIWIVILFHLYLLQMNGFSKMNEAYAFEWANRT